MSDPPRGPPAPASNQPPGSFRRSSPPAPRLLRHTIQPEALTGVVPHPPPNQQRPPGTITPPGALPAPQIHEVRLREDRITEIEQSSRNLYLQPPTWLHTRGSGKLSVGPGLVAPGPGSSTSVVEVPEGGGMPPKSTATTTSYAARVPEQTEYCYPTGGVTLYYIM